MKKSIYLFITIMISTFIMFCKSSEALEQKIVFKKIEDMGGNNLGKTFAKKDLFRPQICRDEHN